MTMSSLDEPTSFMPVAQSFKHDAVAWLPTVPWQAPPTVLAASTGSNAASS
jgi:hypothetical protein